MPKLYDYVLGQTQSLSLSIPVSSVKEDIRATLRAAFLKSPPAEDAGLTPSQLSQLFDSAWSLASGQMPEALEIDASELLPPPTDVAQALSEAEKALATARLYVGYYQQGFWGLVGLTALLMLGIVLVNRSLAGSSRALGGTLATYGVLEAAGLIISQGLLHGQLPALSKMCPSQSSRGLSS